MKKRFIILILLIVALSSLSYFWWQQALSPIDRNDSSYKSFTVNRGEDARTIAKNLQRDQLIRDPIAFFLLVRFGGLQENLQSGEYRLSPSLDLRTIANTLTHGTSDVWITTLEGWRNEEIALKLAQTLGIPESEFLKIAKIGYMFPDTYLVPQETSASSVTKLFWDTFNNKVTPDIISKAKQKGLSLDELVTVASLVEREAQHDSDRPIVASVILNRLKMGMELDIDATIQYALGYQTQEKSWWKKELTFEDLKIDSPYNTYTNKGLPPTAICNPGLAVIKAVINAPDTDYIYYVSDKDGNIHPAKNDAEHNANIEKYLNR